MDFVCLDHTLNLVFFVGEKFWGALSHSLTSPLPSNESSLALIGNTETC